MPKKGAVYQFGGAQQESVGGGGGVEGQGLIPQCTLWNNEICFWFHIFSRKREIDYRSRNIEDFIFLFYWLNLHLARKVAQILKNVLLVAKKSKKKQEQEMPSFTKNKSPNENKCQGYMSEGIQGWTK